MDNTLLNQTIIDLKPESKRDMVEDDVLTQGNKILTILWVPLSLCSIITNGINTKTFVAMGIKDGVTVSFLFLSISDLCFSITFFSMSCAFIAFHLEYSYGIVFPVQPFAMTLILGNITIFFAQGTCFTTTFLAIARCMCVARPLHFKDTFTKFRAKVIHIVFIFVALALYIPTQTQFGIRYGYDPWLNVSRLMYWASKHRVKVKDVTLLILDTILPVTTVAILVMCISVMAVCLHRSSKFREASTAQGKTPDEKDKPTAFKLTGKDLQVVKQVLLISFIYIICTIPKMSTAIYSLIDGEFEMNKSNHLLYYFLQTVRATAEQINAATTLPIYLNYNSKFRSMCWPRAK